MDFSGLIGAIGSALKAGLGAITTFINSAISALSAEIQAVWGQVEALASWVFDSISGILDWLKNFPSWFKDNIWDPLISKLEDIRDRLKKFFKPLTDAIKQYKKMMQDNYRLYVKPVIDFIQRIRKVLVIFRILGFKWAKQLDQKLLKLETDIQSAFMASWKNLNILSDWVNFIVDPFGKLSQVPLLGAIADSIGAILGIMWGKQNNPLGAGDQAAQDTDAHYFDPKVAAARFQLSSQIGLLPEDTDYMNQIRKASNDLGYTV